MAEPEVQWASEPKQAGTVHCNRGHHYVEEMLQTECYDICRQVCKLLLQVVHAR